jgi:hypothetical protein
LAKEWFQRLAKDNEKVSVSFKLICSVSNVSRTEKDIVKLCERISSGTVLVSPQAYQQYVDYTVAHLYVTNPQARIYGSVCGSFSIKDCGRRSAQGVLLFDPQREKNDELREVLHFFISSRII